MTCMNTRFTSEQASATSNAKLNTPDSKNVGTRNGMSHIPARDTSLSDLMFPLPPCTDRLAISLPLTPTHTFTYIYFHQTAIERLAQVAMSRLPQPTRLLHPTSQHHSSASSPLPGTGIRTDTGTRTSLLSPKLGSSVPLKISPKPVRHPPDEHQCIVETDI
jgi:hypothetical protein